MEKRSERTLVCLEPTLNQKWFEESVKMNLTTSEYVRKLLLDKFMEEGVLTQEEFNKMFT